MQVNVRLLMVLVTLFSSSTAVQVQQQAEAPGIAKVVELLKDMKAQVSKEAEEDKIAYDKFMCWCETGKKQKTEAVENAEKAIAELEAFMEEAASIKAQLATEIDGLIADQEEDKEALATATSIREKEHEEFLAAKADMEETIDLLTQALEVLSKVQLMQKNSKEAKPALLQLHHILKHVQPRFGQFKNVMQKDLWDVMSSLGGGDEASSAFLPKLSVLSQKSKLLPWEKTDEEIGKAAKPNDLKGAAAGAKSYNSRSGSIFGILEQMKEEFVDNLSKAEKEEADAQASYEKLKAAKLAEIQAAHDQQFAKEQELTETRKKEAEAEGDLTMTKNALAKDQETLLFLEKTCKVADEDYQGRVKVRSEELVAITETIEILTGDDVRELFSKTLGLGKTTPAPVPASFLQVDAEGKRSSTAARILAMAHARDQAADKAMRHILHVARKHKDWILASLAVRIRLDKFTKVKEAMDKMLADLKEQQQAEYEKNEFCKKQIDETEDQIQAKTWEKEDQEEKKLSLENTIKALEAEIEELKKAVSDMEVSLKEAGEQRKEENQIFQTAVADQRATILVLNKAKARMAEFYAAKLLQVSNKKQAPDTTPGADLAAPPPEPKEYKKSEAGGGVMQLLEQIITEATSEEAELVLTEQNAQGDYATYAADTTATIEANRDAILEKTKLSAEAESALSETEGALLATNEALEELAATLKNIHLDCDWLLKYFDIRQKARKEEMGSIVEAKAIISGADFGTAMVQADDAEQ